MTNGSGSRPRASDVGGVPWPLVRRIALLLAIAGLLLNVVTIPHAWSAWRAWQAGLPDAYPGANRGVVLGTVSGVAMGTAVVLNLVLLPALATQAQWTRRTRQRFWTGMTVVAVCVVVSVWISVVRINTWAAERRAAESRTHFIERAPRVGA